MRSPILVSLLLPLAVQAITVLPSLSFLDKPLAEESAVVVAPNRSISLGPWGTFVLAGIPEDVAAVTPPTNGAAAQLSAVARLLHVGTQASLAAQVDSDSIVLTAVLPSKKDAELDVRRRR